jgi:hypothetical protein
MGGADGFLFEMGSGASNRKRAAVLSRIAASNA